MDIVLASAHTNSELGIAAALLMLVIGLAVLIIVGSCIDPDN